MINAMYLRCTPMVMTTRTRTRTVGVQTDDYIPPVPVPVVAEHVRVSSKLAGDSMCDDDG